MAKPVDEITWDVQIGGLLDLESLVWNGCSAMQWDEERKMLFDKKSECPNVSRNRALASPAVYRSDVLDGLALAPPPSVLLLPLAPALALRIDRSTSLQYLSLSSNRCANLACSGSEDGGRSARAMIWLNVQRVST